MYRGAEKTGTMEMGKRKHVQLIALRNRDIALQRIWPFNNFEPAEWSNARFRHFFKQKNDTKLSFVVSPCIKHLLMYFDY